MRRRIFLTKGALATLSGVCFWKANSVQKSNRCFDDLPWHDPSKPDIDPLGASSADIQQFIQQRVFPIIEDTHADNLLAVNRAVDALRSSLHRYRQGITPFCHELTTYTTRLGVLRRVPGDWWYSQDTVGRYVASKFAKHLFTDAKLKTDINIALSQFYSEESANRNRMLARVKAAVAASELEALDAFDVDSVSVEFGQKIQEFSREAGTSSLVRFILTEIVCGVGGGIAETIVAQLVTRLTAMIGSTIAVAGGATASSTLVGGGLGSWTGPLGAAAGIAAGLVFGLLVDSWMSKNFEQKISNQLRKLIDTIEREIVFGDSPSTGVENGLRQTCELIKLTHLRSVEHQLMKGILS